MKKIGIDSMSIEDVVMKMSAVEESEVATNVIWCRLIFAFWQYQNSFKRLFKMVRVPAVRSTEKNYMNVKANGTHIPKHMIEE